MIDLKSLRQSIKHSSCQKNVAKMLIFLDYEVNSNFKFKLRDEQIPSASIAKDGTIHDFGSGWSGDIVAILHEYKHIPLKEATIYVAQLLSIDLQGFKNE